MTIEDLLAVINADIRDAAPEAFGGSDEWDLNDAFRDGWEAALDEVAARIKAERPAPAPRATVMPFAWADPNADDITDDERRHRRDHEAFLVRVGVAP